MNHERRTIAMDKHQRYSTATKVTAVGFIFNILLALFKGFAGIVGHSEAVLADAVESFSDIVATSVVWVGLRFAHKPSDFEHPYGHQRVETASALIVGIIILGGSFTISGYAVSNIISGRIAVPTTLALVAAIMTIIIKEGLYRYTIKIGRKINSMPVIANAHDHRKDALTSIATLVGVAGAMLGIRVLDPLAAIVVAVIILRIGFSVSRSALNELLDISPSPEIMAKIRQTAEVVPGVEHVKRFRARRTGPYMFVDVEIEIDESMTVLKSHEVAEEVKTHLRKELPDIRDIMVHVEPHSPHS